MFDQEYMCSFDAAILGAVLGRWMGRARDQGRVMESGVFDQNGSPIYISSDLGFRDTASWWFWQPRQNGFGLVGYLGQSGLDADEWIEKLSDYLLERGMTLGKIWLPHDARNKTFATKHSPMERFLLKFGASKISVVPQTKISDRINAARRVVERCWFDEEHCFDGISGLTSWRFKFDLDTRTMSKEPEHDWASHPGDAFSYGCQMMEMEAPSASKEPPRFLHETRFNELSWQQTNTMQESDGF